MKKIQKIQDGEGEDPQLINQMIDNKIYVAGIDEVGKGSLFGPIFAGAVALKESAKNELIILGLKDSKKLSSKKRARLVPFIKELSVSWGLGQSSSKEIDNYGIRKATELAMIRAIQKLSKKPNLLLIDGNLPLRMWEGSQKTFIGGDNLYPEISAASIIAKEARDSLIKRLGKQFPNYGLETNVGYGTKSHRESLIKFGATKLHRKSFLLKIIQS